MSQSFDVTVELVRMHCSVCGILFGATQILIDLRSQDGGNLYCPNGHRLNWPNGKTPQEWAAEAESLQDEVEELRRANTALLSRLDQLEARTAEGSEET